MRPHTGGLLSARARTAFTSITAPSPALSAPKRARVLPRRRSCGKRARGLVTNCGTDVEISGITDTNHVYAGGLYGMDNRVTTFNCYALGNVTGNSQQ